MSAAVRRRTSAAKVSFDVLLESNSAWFEWIDGAVQFENLLRDKLPWEQLDGPAKAFAGKRLKATAPAQQLLLNSFYLTMAAGFEDFLRSTIRETTRRVASERPKYEDLEVATRNMHIRESARLLRRMDSPPDYLAVNIDDLCRGLGSCVPGSTAVHLNPEAFSDVDGLIRLESFLERLTALGKPMDWEKLANQQLVKVAIGLPKGKSGQVAKALQSELRTISRFRNRIAHIGGSAADVTLEVLRDHRNLLKELTTAIEVAVQGS